MDQLLGLALNAFGHFIEDVGRLMHPASLLRYWAIFFPIKMIASREFSFYSRCLGDFFKPRNASLAGLSDACQSLTISKTMAVA